MSTPQPPMLPPIPTGIGANMSLETEQLVQCPYNPAHSILRYRMQTHLHRCRKQHQSFDWATCSHNGTHHMPLAEIDWHEAAMCPDRHTYQAQFFSVDKDNEGHKSLAPLEHIPLPASSENWDDGVENHYDPAANAAKKSLIRGIHCVPPSERKAFKHSHRQHIRDNEDDVLTSTKLKFEQMKEARKEQPPQPYEPLRPPREMPKGFSFGRGVNLRDKEASGPSPPPPPPPPQHSGAQWSGLGRGSLGSLGSVSASEPRAPGTASVPAWPAWPAWGRAKPNP